MDRQALSFVTSAMKENAVPALQTAYQDAKLTNQIERGLVLNALLSFTGPSTQANGVFSQLISDESVPSGIRAITIQGLAGGSSKEPPSDPKIIQARMDVLRDVRGRLKDERLLRVIDETTAQLQTLLTGVPR